MYLALLTVHASQGCFQCETQGREQSFREQKEAPGSPVNNEEIGSKVLCQWLQKLMF